MDEAEIKVIEHRLNDFFVNNSNDIIVQNLDYIHYMTNKIYHIIHKYLNEYNVNFNEGKFPIYSFENRIDFVKEFYKNYNLALNIDEIIDKGFIDIDKNNYENEYGDFGKIYPDLNGLSYDSNVIINSTGYIFDSFILTHELSHYQDHLYKRNDTIDLFTEALAFSEENIMINTMSNHDMEIDFFKKNELQVFYRNCSDVLDAILMLRTYQEFGDISYDSFNLLFNQNKEVYDKYLLYLNDYISKYNYEDFKYHVRYVNAILYMPTILKKYFLNDEYKEKFRELRLKINNVSIKEFIKTLELNNNEELFSNLEEYIKEVIKIKKEKINENKSWSK